MTPEALNILYANALRLRAGNEYSNASEIVRKIGANPSTRVSLPVKMIDSDGLDIQRAAAANPNLPKSYKIAYLTRGWNSPSPEE